MNRRDILIAVTIIVIAIAAFAAFVYFYPMPGQLRI